MTGVWSMEMENWWNIYKSLRFLPERSSKNFFPHKYCSVLANFSFSSDAIKILFSGFNPCLLNQLILNLYRFGVSVATVPLFSDSWRFWPAPSEASKLSGSYKWVLRWRKSSFSSFFVCIFVKFQKSSVRNVTRNCLSRKYRIKTQDRPVGRLLTAKPARPIFRCVFCLFHSSSKASRCWWSCSVLRSLIRNKPCKCFCINLQISETDKIFFCTLVSATRMSTFCVPVSVLSNTVSETYIILF